MKDGFHSFSVFLTFIKILTFKVQIDQVWPSIFVFKLIVSFVSIFHWFLVSFETPWSFCLFWVEKYQKNLIQIYSYEQEVSEAKRAKFSKCNQDSIENTVQLELLYGWVCRFHQEISNFTFFKQNHKKMLLLYLPQNYF
jgi:hypothetical protein